MLKTKQYSPGKQYVVSLSLLTVSAGFCFFVVDWIGYQAVALLLLLVVSLTAMLFDILPVVLSALFSALIWNFFFIPPTFTFHIGTPEDALMFLMYFVIASLHAVLTYKIREYERHLRTGEEKAQAIRLYDTLFNSLSHELKTPISGIITAIDTLKQDLAGLSEGAREQLHDEIELAALRLNRHVENLLNMSRLESGLIQPRADWCCANDLMFSVIKENLEQAGSRQIRFTPCTESLLMKLDAGLVWQVLHNLLHNALQHTPEGSTIEVFIEPSRANKTCKWRVRDNGLGVPPEEALRIFDKFYRLERGTPGGTGLGLSIVKGLVEAMDGKVHLKNCPEGGAEFTVCLPCEFSQNLYEDDEQG